MTKDEYKKNIDNSLDEIAETAMKLYGLSEQEAKLVALQSMMCEIVYNLAEVMARNATLQEKVEQLMGKAVHEPTDQSHVN